MLDVAHVVAGLAHEIEAGAARALGPPPDDLDAQHVGAVDLVPHLDADLGEVVPEEDGRVNARALDRQADAGERLAPVRRDLQHVAGLGGVRVLLREEGGARARPVQPPDLLRVVRDQRVRVRGAGRGRRCVDGEGGADRFAGGFGGDNV